MQAAMTQIPLDLRHRTAYGREDFLVTGCNQEAVAWIDRWPAWPAPVLVLHGPAASGKTHLAAVWQALSGATELDAVELAESDNGLLPEQGQHFLLDPADFAIGDRAAEEVLFHLYNGLKGRGGTLLLTLRSAPQHLDFAIADLASRLRGAPCAAIAEPDDALLAAILVKMFSDRQLHLGTDVADYVLPRMERSFAAARDLVERADRLALAERKAITIPLVRRILSEDRT